MQLLLEVHENVRNKQKKISKLMVGLLVEQSTSNPIFKGFNTTAACSTRKC
jgi:hypothetical protein